jgi:LemA protein
MWEELMDYSTILLGVGVVGAGFVCMTTYNRLMALDSRCDKASADIDVQLKHRHALIPNLVELLKGFMGHEVKTLEIISVARQNAMAALTADARMQAEGTLSHNLNLIMMNAEQNPELQANEHFRALRHEIGDAENKIAAARRFLNLAVDEYNSSIRQFPSSFFANLGRLSKRNFFDLGYDRAVVEEGPAIKF